MEMGQGRPIQIKLARKHDTIINSKETTVFGYDLLGLAAGVGRGCVWCVSDDDGPSQRLKVEEL
jgi:hypothetical protein